MATNIPLDSIKAFKASLDCKMQYRSSETNNMPIISSFECHNEKNKFTPCKVNNEGSLTRIWCNVHHAAEYSCMYSDDGNYNTTCIKCCSEKKTLIIQFEYATQS